MRPIRCQVILDVNFSVEFFFKFFLEYIKFLCGATEGALRAHSGDAENSRD